MKLQGTLALVTGASSGIGASTARELGARGARVALVARNAERLASVAREIERGGGWARSFVADLADPARVRDVAARVTAELGPVELLVNNAGAGRWHSVLETSAEQAEQLLRVPYLAAFNLTRELLPAMLARKRGRIVNVTSPAMRLAWPGAAGYVAARRAMEAFDACLGVELAQSGVRCTLVVLGAVESPYWEHNPGSRERLLSLPGIGMLSCGEAAASIVAAVDRDRRRVVTPRVFRFLFMLEAACPTLVERITASRARAAQSPDSRS